MLHRTEFGVLLQHNCAAQCELAVKQRIDNTETICFIVMNQTFALASNSDTCYCFCHLRDDLAAGKPFDGV